MILRNKDRAIELLSNFKKDGISHDAKRGLSLVLEWQDLIGRSNVADIFKFYEPLTHEQRRTFIWVCCSTLSSDMAESVLLYTVGNVIRNMVKNELTEEYIELNNREADFDSHKKAVHKKLAKYRKQVEVLEADALNLVHIINRLRDKESEYKREVFRLREEVKKFEDDSEKFHSIRRILGINE